MRHRRKRCQCGPVRQCDRVRTLWLEKRGKAEPADLSDHLPAMLGCWTEAFNRMWFEKVTAHTVTRIGELVQCPRYGWRRCTLDGFVEEESAVLEAKHNNAFASVDEVIERYMPQLQQNMAVSGSDLAYLSVLVGNHKYEVIEIAADWLYQVPLDRELRRGNR